MKQLHGDAPAWCLQKYADKYNNKYISEAYKPLTVMV